MFRETCIKFLVNKRFSKKDNAFDSVGKLEKQLISYPLGRLAFNENTFEECEEAMIYVKLIRKIITTLYRQFKSVYF
jgi:hypothetical protein